MQIKNVSNSSVRKYALLLAIALLVLPHYSYGFSLLNAHIHVRAQIVSFINIAVFVTALISIKQYFWPGDNNTMPFHIFNIAFVILFYAIGLPFLITNREYYEAYAHLTPGDVLGKFFLSINISSFAQWVIIASVFINVRYIQKFRADYYHAGINKEDDDDDIDYPGEPSTPKDEQPD